MPRIIDVGGIRVIIISEEDSGICTECGVNDELRPYGLNFAKICYDCAMKNEARTKLMLEKIYSGMREN